MHPSIEFVTTVWENTYMQEFGGEPNRTISGVVFFGIVEAQS